MSRFYDALRQASRFHRNATRTPPAPEPLSAFGLEALTISHFHEDAGLVNGETPGSAAEPPRVDPWKISQEHTPPPRVASAEDFGSQTEVAIDRKARVIPNVADHVVVEHYRRLRTKLVQQHAVKPFHSLLVTSPSPQEGKSVTALNLALSFSMLPAFRIAIVDGDLRRGTLGQWLGLTERPGLSNLIEGTATLEEVVFRCKEIPVHFIVSGTSALAPAELLHSPDLGVQFRRMTEQFDLVVVDSPPVNIITDAQLLAAHCDAVLMVARAFRTTCKSLEKAVQDLSAFNIIGTVLNGGSRMRRYRSYNGYY